MNGRTWGRGCAPRRRTALAGALTASLVLGPLLPGCGSEGPPEPPEPPRGILWIAVDTLRADRLSCYGHDRETSPELDALAAAGVRFERAYSTAPWTLPSVATMLTGRLPSAHGVDRPERVLDPEADSILRRLSERGWTTVGITSNALAGSRNGLDAHFNRFDESEAQGHLHVSTPGLVERVQETLDELAAGDRPWLVFVLLFDPHYQYQRHPDVGYAADRAGRITGAESYRELREMELDAEEAALLRDIYDEEVRFTDAGIGAMVAHLDRLGLGDRSHVVVTADHGEEFLERGWLGHTVSLYDELVRVPLVLRGPGLAPGTVVAEPVSLVELGPALLELAAGVDAETRLAALASGRRPPDGAPVLMEVDFEATRLDRKNVRMTGIVRGRWKLVRDEKEGALHLYDLAADPAELDDLAAREPERVAELAAELDDGLERLRGDAGSFTERALTAEEREQLERLGYVGR